MNQYRVVVTGIGAITPIGIGREAFWEGLLAGRNGISRVTLFDPTDFRSQMAGEVKDFAVEDWIDRKLAKRVDRFTHFAMVAADLAMKDAGLGPDPSPGSNGFPFDEHRAGVIIGSGIGGMQTIEHAHADLLTKGTRAVGPLAVSRALINTAACMVSIRHGLKGPLSAPSVACSTGANAVGDAYRILQRGDADIMLSGGAEASVSPFPFAAFCATRAMSGRNDDPERASRPFDKNRDGFVMGEGAGVVVLESLDHALGRNAPIYAELIGYGNTADAFHITAPEPEGDGMARAMEAALRDAGVSPSDIHYVNAHGTSTILNDKTENAAMLRVFGEHAQRLKISSIKSMIGHLLAAAGAVEFAATVLSVSTGHIPPTINYEEPDPDCPLDYVTRGAESIELDTAMTQSFGFGGGNACLVVKRYQERRP
ncbi:beta-ketoacyl-ACP synthase II [Candidatus Bipolaricaulota bacterium]|nr:beta-ketoacyl-ACP synthase II [Candidatus Bipolaricaulota bacterium]